MPCSGAVLSHKAWPDSHRTGEQGPTIRVLPLIEHVVLDNALRPLDLLTGDFLQLTPGLFQL